MSYQDITIVSGATTITLPGGMTWIDRRTFDPVAQSIQRSATGAQIIEEFQMIGGYPITLVARGDGDEWVYRPEIDALRTLAATPLTSPMTLTYNDGTVMS